MTAPSRAFGRPVEALGRMCQSKLRYPDEITARAAGLHYREHYATIALYVYRCPHCAGYHLTRAAHNKRASVEWGMQPAAN